jgi:hypothetical protein
MPQTHPTASPAGLPPVPVAVLLPRAQHRRPHLAPDDAGSTWCGIDAGNAAALICAYSRLDDVVLTVGPEPMLAQAAQYLGRHPATLLTDGDRWWVRAAGRIQRRVGQLGAGTILAQLPDHHVEGADLPATTHAMGAWRGLLRPGGHLLLALTTTGPGHGGVSPRSNVITAARTAGLLWQQEFLVPLVPLPQYEPRAMPDTAATTPAALVEGRHAVIHLKLLAFRNPALGGDRA